MAVHVQVPLFSVLVHGAPNRENMVAIIIVHDFQEIDGLV